MEDIEREEWTSSNIGGISRYRAAKVLRILTSIDKNEHASICWNVATNVGSDEGDILSGEPRCSFTISCHHFQSSVETRQADLDILWDLMEKCADYSDTMPCRIERAGLVDKTTWF